MKAAAAILAAIGFVCLVAAIVSRADGLGLSGTGGMAVAVEHVGEDRPMTRSEVLSLINGSLFAEGVGDRLDMSTEDAAEAAAEWEAVKAMAAERDELRQAFQAEDGRLDMWANIGALAQHPSVSDANWIGMKIPQYAWQGVKQVGTQVITDPGESAAWVAGALLAIWAEDELNGGGGSSPPPQQKTLKATVNADGTTIEATGVDTAEGEAEFYDADGNLRVKTSFKTSTNE